MKPVIDKKIQLIHHRKLEFANLNINPSAAHGTLVPKASL
jgi:hypothetical protein